MFASTQIITLVMFFINKITNFILEESEKKTEINRAWIKPRRILIRNTKPCLLN